MAIGKADRSDIVGSWLASIQWASAGLDRLTLKRLGPGVDTGRMVCDRCGATSRPGAAWCGLCHAALGQQPSPDVVRRAAPPPDVRPELVVSRWRKSDTTFGPVGRVAWTVGVVLGLALCLFSGDLLAIAGWGLIAAPLVLRSVWAPGRTVVRPAQPRSAQSTVASSASIVRHRMLSASALVVGPGCGLIATRSRGSLIAASTARVAGSLG